MPKVAKVKNKAPAEVQITAEQLLREAKERDLEILPPPPKQKISDEAELADYQQRKRKTFEDNLRKNRNVSIRSEPIEDIFSQTFSIVAHQQLDQICSMGRVAEGNQASSQYLGTCTRQ